MTELMRRWMGTRGAALAACLSVCSACTSGADYERPVVSTPTAYRFGDQAASAPLADSGAAWWQAFGDEVLDRLVRESLSSNRDLRIAVARIDEADALLMGTRSQGLPQIGYGVSAGRERSPQPAGAPSILDPERSSFSTIVSASWEIDLWGRIRRETEAARANLLASEEGRRGVELTLIAGVISSYITLLDLDNQLQIAETTVSRRKQSVAMFQARLTGGAISEFEMSQVQADYETAVAAVPELRKLVAQQEDALSILLGRNPGPIERGRPLSGLASPAIPSGLPAELLTRRPDILQAEQQLIASNALIGAARARYFPRISLTGFAGLASTDLGDLFEGSSRTWSFVGDVTGPIYTGGNLAAATGQAEARRDQALAVYERTIQNAFGEVEDALIAIQASGEIADANQRRVRALERGLALVQARYDNGYADSLDVLDTERNLFSAQLALADARGDRFRVLVDLYRALGGDWVEDTEGVAVARVADRP